MEYKITASLVLYNPDEEKLMKVISSFLGSKISGIKLCFVDNSPQETNFMKSTVAKDNERLEYIFNNANIGFGAAHNIAIKKYVEKSEYHVILNPDIYFDENLLPSLYERLEKDKEVGLCIPKVFYPDDTIQYVNRRLSSPMDTGLRFATGKLKTVGPILKKLFKKSMDRYELKDIDQSTSFLCPSIQGSFMFFRCKALQNIGLFDERYFMYFEDIDLSRRCATEYKNVVFTDLKMYHSWARGSYKNKKLLQYHINSAIAYFNKWGWLFDKQRKQLNNTIQEYK
ncbi:MAG: glycosyltransferase [Alphaproteobacteria bacterium]|nr:glycosyltransferase [Alphaproteobacteria bacterium]